MVQVDAREEETQVEPPAPKISVKFRVLGPWFHLSISGGCAGSRDTGEHPFQFV